jgi:iron complex transport system ATP-binding protein
VVPQSSSTDFTFSAYDIVMMGRIPHRRSRMAGPTSEDAEIVKDAMQRTNTWRFASRPFSNLSGGERQRVVVARAVAQRPKTLLLDEPTVYLDINGQLEVMEMVKSLNKKEGITVIAVLHDMNLAARYCDRIALLDNGRLEAIGPPADVLTADTLRDVYGVDVIVRKDPYSGSIYVVPHSTASISRRHGTRVHVICGGGTGGPVMKSLLDKGFVVSAGVLNVLDSDFENARDLHVPVAAETPFAPVGTASYEENLGMIAESKAVVLSPFPVGPGNIKNLEAASDALKKGKRIFVMRPPSGQIVDFVGGAADSLINELISSGAVPVEGIDQLISKLDYGG